MLQFRWRDAGFLLLLLLASCGKSLPSLENVDLVKWKEDRNACLGDRTTMADELRIQKNKLLGLSEMDVVSLLGRPDENELYTRNQKFYHYYMEPAPDCINTVNAPKKLTIRFNAMGLVKEVAVE